MMTFDEFLDKLNQAALAERQMAREANRKAELYEAQIAGMKQARDILRATYPDITEMPNKEMPDDQQRRQRRDVRGMVLTVLKGATLGISVDSLVDRLDITKAQAEAALEYHATKGEARRSDSGHWFPKGDETFVDATKPQENADTPISEERAVPRWVQEAGDGKSGVDLNHQSGFQPGRI